MAAENPFSLDKINLRLPEFSGLERDILLAIRVEQPRGDNFLFANSSLVKCRLLEHANVSPNGEVHPSMLEAAALVASVTYFERLNCQSPNYCEFQTLRNDNYSMAYWIFVCLFKDTSKAPGAFSRLQDELSESATKKAAAGPGCLCLTI